MKPADQDQILAKQPDLDRVIDQVRPLIMRYVTRRIRNRDHAEEVISRIFEALVRTWGNFRGDCPVDAYAVRLAANAVKNYYARDLAKQSRQISFEDWRENVCLQQKTGDVGPYEEVAVKEQVLSLITEMQKVCSPTECAVINLVYQGNSMDEIASLLSLKGATVRSHFLRGREHLLAHLLVKAPDLLGGDELIEAAILKLRGQGTGSLSNDEVQAIRSRKGPAPLLRKAMLKIAPFLGILIAVLWKVKL